MKTQPEEAATPIQTDVKIEGKDLHLTKGLDVVKTCRDIARFVEMSRVDRACITEALDGLQSQLSTAIKERDAAIERGTHTKRLLSD